MGKGGDEEDDDEAKEADSSTHCGCTIGTPTDRAVRNLGRRNAEGEARQKAPATLLFERRQNMSSSFSRTVPPSSEIEVFIDSKL